MLDEERRFRKTLNRAMVRPAARGTRAHEGGALSAPPPPTPYPTPPLPLPYPSPTPTLTPTLPLPSPPPLAPPSRRASPHSLAGGPAGPGLCDE